MVNNGQKVILKIVTTETGVNSRLNFVNKIDIKNPLCV